MSTTPDPKKSLKKKDDQKANDDQSKSPAPTEKAQDKKSVSQPDKSQDKKSVSQPDKSQDKNSISQVDKSQDSNNKPKLDDSDEDVYKKTDKGGKASESGSVAKQGAFMTNPDMSERGKSESRMVESSQQGGGGNHISLKTNQGGASGGKLDKSPMASNIVMI